MKTLEIVVHCFAEQHDVYARALTVQLSSLILNPPKASVVVSICTAARDERTLDTVQSLAMAKQNSRLDFRTHLMSKERLFRRAIGRNDLARTTQADAVHFADADYFYGVGFVDDLLAAQWPSPLAIPGTLQIHKTHIDGDAALATVNCGEVFQPDLAQFVRWRTRIAIGGIQFVTGETARSGYLDGHRRYQKPVDPTGGFRDTFEDKVYRGGLGCSIVRTTGVLYRMRHTTSAFEPAENRR